MLPRGSNEPKLRLRATLQSHLYTNSLRPLSEIIIMAPQDRLSQISSHLANPCGLLSGQVAIITGGGQGIGAATARLFAAEGAKVLVADVDQAKAAAVAHEINTSAAAAEGQGPRASFAAGDVLDEAYLKNVIKAAVELGGGKIHIVVNNAGFTWDGVIHKVRVLGVSCSSFLALALFREYDVTGSLQPNSILIC